MSDLNKNESHGSMRPRTYRVTLKDAVILAGGIVGIVSFFGQWFVYGDRVTKQGSDMQQVQVEIRTHNDRLTVAEQWQKAADPLMMQVRTHLSDRNLHTTPEDVNARVALQMQPFLVNMEAIKGDVKSQQRQLDRIEELLNSMAGGKKVPERQP